MDLKRRDGESALQYHKRLVYGKLVDKTLSDIDFAELSEYVYGQPYESNSARKMLYGSKKTLDLMEDERRADIHDTGMLEEIDTKMLELQKERQKFFDQRREWQKLVSKDGRADHLRDMLAQAADQLAGEIGTMFTTEGPEYGDSENEAVVVFSDWHYGMKTSEDIKHLQRI